VLHGVARREADGLTRVRLDGGGVVTAAEPGEGPVAVSVYPWEISLEPAGTAAVGSTQNHLPAEVVTVTRIGTRVRVGLAAPQPLVAEVTGPAVDRLGLVPGQRVVASWKATATRVVPLA
jgi:molybdate transport system ATP-binding protein